MTLPDVRRHGLDGADVAATGDDVGSHTTCSSRPAVFVPAGGVERRRALADGGLATPGDRRILAHLRARVASGERYVRSKGIGEAVELSAKQVGVPLSKYRVRADRPGIRRRAVYLGSIDGVDVSGTGDRR